MINALLACIVVAGAAWLCVIIIRVVLALDPYHRGERAAIAARADWEHAALMRGDMLAGIYGIYPPAPECLTPHETKEQ